MPSFTMIVTMGGEGPQEGSEQAALSIIIITSSLSDPSFYDKDIFFRPDFTPTASNLCTTLGTEMR